MQQPQAVLGEQYRSKYARDYSVQPKLWSWSGATATILDDQGSLAFSVDGQAWALRGDRVLTDAVGNPVCALQAENLTMKRLWRIYRGALMNEETLAATINKQLWSMHYGIEAKLPGSQETEFLLRAQKAISVGRLKYDIIHRGNFIEHAVHMRIVDSTARHCGPFCGDQSAEGPAVPVARFLGEVMSKYSVQLWTVIRSDPLWIGRNQVAGPSSEPMLPSGVGPSVLAVA